MDNKKMAALNEMDLENVNGGIIGFDDIVLVIVALAGVATLGTSVGIAANQKK